MAVRVNYSPMGCMTESIPFKVGLGQCPWLVLGLQNFLVCKWDLGWSSLEKSVAQGENVGVLIACQYHFIPHLPQLHEPCIHAHLCN